MSIIVLKLRGVKVATANRPSQCPHCKGEILQRWGGEVRQIRDPHVKEVIVYRYHCTHCRRTFRHYPEGVDQGQQSQRLRKLAALCWVLGLSYRGVAAVFAIFGVGIGRMTAWRDAQELAGETKRRRIWKPVRVLGLDGAYVRGWGETQAVVVAVDLGDGQPVGIGHIDEKDPQAVRRWLEPLVKRLGVSVIVTDDLKTYRSVARQLGLEHQVCQFHLRRWTGRSLYQLKQELSEDYQAILAEVQQLIDELPDWGGSRLFELWKRTPVEKSARDQPRTPSERLRNLMIRLSENWPRYRVFDWQPDVPWTNNTTEQIIGRMKMRSRTVRGYKNEEGMLNGLMLAGSGVC
jgi:transposase-like protein